MPLSDNCIVIPLTEPHRYLSGIAALNLPSASGTGDWHFQQTFCVARSRRSRTFIAGEGCLTNTLPFLGNAGIYECSETLRRVGVGHVGLSAYAATHARAIADLVISAIQAGQRTDHITLDDWMPRKAGKKEVLDLLRVALPVLSSAEARALQTWISDCISRYPELNLPITAGQAG